MSKIDFIKKKKNHRKTFFKTSNLSMFFFVEHFDISGEIRIYFSLNISVFWKNICFEENFLFFRFQIFKIYFRHENVIFFFHILFSDKVWLCTIQKWHLRVTKLQLLEVGRISEVCDIYVTFGHLRVKGLLPACCKSSKIIRFFFELFNIDWGS